MLMILAPVLVFGLVVFVHELGHFIAAKLIGVYAPRFSIGFGPALWRRRFGETEYAVSVLPLGGYVRMASEHDEEMARLEGGGETLGALQPGEPGYDPEGLVPFGPRPVPRERLFESQSLPARIVILVAGVTMNVVLALVVAVALALSYGRTVVPTTVVGAVHPTPSLSALSDLHVGDTIRAVNGHPVSSWNDVVRAIARSTTVVDLTTQRGGVRVPLGGTHAGPEDVDAAIDFFVPPVLDSIVPGDRAAQAGLQRGDSIVAVDSVPIRSWAELLTRIAGSPLRALTLTVAHGGATRSVTVTPRAASEPDPETGAARTVGKIGAKVREPVRHESLGLVDAIGSGSRATWGMVTSVVNVVGGLLTGRVSVKQLSGPVGIAKASVQAARSGMESLFTLIAFLSVNLAVLNLLPIPILDGGQILINVVETAKGSPFSLRTREYILRFGLVAIALLFVRVMYNDTHDGLLKLFGWVTHLFG